MENLNEISLENVKESINNFFKIDESDEIIDCQFEGEELDLEV